MFPSFDMISGLSVYCLQLIPIKTGRKHLRYMYMLNFIVLLFKEIVEEESVATLISVSKSKSKRNLEKLDNVNYKYEDLLEERKQMPEPNKITHNIVCVESFS